MFFFIFLVGFHFSSSYSLNPHCPLKKLIYLILPPFFYPSFLCLRYSFFVSSSCLSLIPISIFSQFCLLYICFSHFYPSYRSLHSSCLSHVSASFLKYFSMIPFPQSFIHLQFFLPSFLFPHICLSHVLPNRPHYP